ncbi:MAG: single-stranded-DNA-specific exonuclease [Microgenomates group bacterium LiPW_31]|nr:MAG: single-stranded-DNA-specific exonuclease [Microgenomates group bacterium LiPW_31]
MKWKILHKKGKTEDIVKILLGNRGLKTKKQQQEFLNPKDPYKLTTKEVGISPLQITKAVKRIKKAIKKKEKIIVYGDYDTDGACATAIIWEVLHSLGANVMPFIPAREEGYGMKVERIEKLAKDEVTLLITVDQGIIANQQVEHAKKLGIDVIITDHHTPGKEKPKAYSIVHTTKLSGSGVSWFLAKKLGKPGLDLVTIGTVSDVMPLLGANRAIVYHGLSDVRKTKRLGLKELYKMARIIPENIGTYEIGFIIGPRLNAAGRMDDPMESLRLVCTKDRKRAQDLAQLLDQKNRQRQRLMDQTTLHARELWLKEDGKSVLIFVNHESYQEGIVGLVAGKLMEEFYRPAIIVARGKEFSRASARSIEEFNIVEAIRACADILGPHGGHPRAAGFTVETSKIEILRNRLIKIAEEKLDKEKLAPVLKIDTEIDPQDLNFTLYQQIQRLSPFGEGNPQPVFASRKVEVIEAKTVGNGGRHLKLRITSHHSPATFDAIAFGMASLYSQLSPEKPIDIAYNVWVDKWNGQRRLQLKIKDLKVGGN